ncbi:hypothetical protein OG271_26265 [Micromonospora rifamycinica]|nr:hypothetical protein [Micromonospora rifamycinica]
MRGDRLARGRIGGYEIVAPLGSGGMGDVFFAVSPTAERVALGLAP